MASQLVNGALWAELESLLPEYQLSPKGGRPPADHRTAYTCVVLVPKTGIDGEDLLLKLVCSYRTCK